MGVVKALLFLVLFLLNPAFSRGESLDERIRIQRDPYAGFGLRGRNCELLKKEAISLCGNGTFKCESLRMGFESWVSIDSCIPDNVRGLHDQSSNAEGPNCFGAAMAISGFRAGALEGGDFEFRVYVGGPLCSLVPPGQKIQKGDIGRIVGPSEETKPESFNANFDNHGFVFLSEKTCFSKNGYLKTAKYKAQPCSEVFQTYHVSDKCRHVDKYVLTKNSKNACRERTEIYRCKPLSEALKKHPVSASVKETLDKASELERSLQSIVLTRDGPIEQLPGLKASVIALRQEVEKELVSRLEAKAKKLLDPLRSKRSDGTSYVSLQQETLSDIIQTVGYGGKKGLSFEDFMVISLWYRLTELEWARYDI